jgi:nickel transport protein
MAEGPAGPSEQAPEAPGTNLSQCQELVAILAEQDQKNSREFRQIKRDIAALALQVAEPGMREIFGGVGYILGLFGVAAYVASRKKVGGGGH